MSRVLLVPSVMSAMLAPKSTPNAPRRPGLMADASPRLAPPKKTWSVPRAEEVVEPDAELFQVVAALDAVGRLPHLLHGREQQADQDADDGDDDEQLDEREAGPPALERPHGPIPPGDMKCLPLE